MKKPMTKTNDDNTRDINSISKSIVGIETSVRYIEADVKDIRSKMEADYVTQDQFEPVKKIVYGLVSVILLAVVGALVALVVRK